MTYQPVIPFSGFAGWSFLNRTRETQQAAFDNSAEIVRNTTYFEENIGKITSAEELMEDRQLLEVALGAFGLDEDINNKFFLQKVLEDGTFDDDALANRLSDTRYLQFSQAFGFGDFDTPRTVLSDFPAEITEAFKNKQFEVAIGNQSTEMRLALGLEESLTNITSLDTTEDGLWYSIMGDTAVREVFETALALPSSVGALGLDQQLTIFRERTESRFGDGEVAQFADPEKREELVRLFLVQSQFSGGSSIAAGQSAALTLLQSSQSDASGLFSLLG